MNMIENRELTMDDYLAMLRRRLTVILIPALLAPLAAFLVSYAFAPRYSSQAQVSVEGQLVSDNYVTPVGSDPATHVNAMLAQVLSDTRLRSLVQGLGNVKAGEEGKYIEEIRENVSITPVDMTATSTGPSKGKKKPGSTPTLGFGINYKSNSARQAQQICGQLAQALIDESQKYNKQVAKGTTDFLNGQVNDAKSRLDDLDKQMTQFKQKYIGQLPEDADNNMRILMSMNSQLDASTQTLNRAQQDKAYTESLLAQQLAAWKGSQSSTNPQTLEQQLTALQSQLLQLQGKYTPDHPDVIKTKADIAEVQKKLAEVNDAASKPAAGNDKASATEPPEIRQLRLQVHQYDGVISQAATEQKRLQSSIQLYQNRTAMSPGIEEQYRGLTRDHDNALANYQDLLAKQSKSELTKRMEDQEQGEHINLVAPANLPESPDFPNRLMFAGAGLGAGLALGIGLALWLEMRDKSIRTEKDAAMVMDLPLLVSVPWVAEETEPVGNGKKPFWGRRNGGGDLKDREKAEV
jgi:polysaccharide chain length determinant protein (PEP-CTERM system associated)